MAGAGLGRVLGRWLGGRGPGRPAVERASRRRRGTGTFYSKHLRVLEGSGEEEGLYGQWGLTSRMLEVGWSAGRGWGKAELRRTGPMEMDPCAQVLHYASSAFEGLRAWRGEDGEVRLFRPHLPLARLLDAARLLELPRFDPRELLHLVDSLVAAVEPELPQTPGASLYLRPCLFSSDGCLGMNLSTEVKLVVLCAVVGPEEGRAVAEERGLGLLGSGEWGRPMRGGAASVRLGANYAGLLKGLLEARAQGYDELAWLSEDGEELLDSSVGSLLALVAEEGGRKTLLAGSLSGLRLGGVVRESVVELVRADGDVGVKETGLGPALLLQAHSEGRLLEVMAADTASGLLPFSRLRLPNANAVSLAFRWRGSFAQRLHQRLLDLQLGRVSPPDPSWTRLPLHRIRIPPPLPL